MEEINAIVVTFLFHLFDFRTFTSRSVHTLVGSVLSGFDKPTE